MAYEKYWQVLDIFSKKPSLSLAGYANYINLSKLHKKPLPTI